MAPKTHPKRKLKPEKPEGEPAGPPVLFGYARVSTDDQNLDMQLDALTRAGVDPDRIMSDKKSGKDLKRGGVLDLLDLMRTGDVLVVWKFDRLSRSLRDLIFLSSHLAERGINLQSLHEKIDTTTPFGRLYFHLMGALAEFERDLIAFRTKAGMQAAKERGQKYGPERTLTDAQLDRAIAWLKPRRHLRGQAKIIAKKLGVSEYTLRNRVLEKHGKRLWPKGPRARD